MADFILELEENNFFYTDNIEELRETNPFIYNCLKTSNISSAIFYSIYGVSNKLGLVALTSVNKMLEKNDVLPAIAEATQRVSSLLSFEELEGDFN